MRQTTNTKNAYANIIRKCGSCCEELEINKNNINDSIYYDKKTYHSKCFIDMCEKRSNNKRKDISDKWTQILSNIKSIQEESYSHLMSSLNKEDLFIFIQNEYDITIIPSTIWQKISDINNGSYKNMCGNGIPLNHLLDMWQRKMELLNEINAKNIVKGVNMTSAQRISYDLSILVNKYDSYLKWLEKKRIIDIDNNTTIEPESFITKTVVVNSTSTANNCNDISDLVDDIFG